MSIPSTSKVCRQNKAAVKLAAKDRFLFDVSDYEIYSNQWIPLTAKCTIAEKVRTAAILDNKCSGGAIAHINLENNFPNTDTAWEKCSTILPLRELYTSVLTLE